MNGAQEFLTSQHLIGIAFVKLSSSEALECDEKRRDLMAGMLFESLLLLHSAQKDITENGTFLSQMFFFNALTIFSTQLVSAFFPF